MAKRILAIESPSLRKRPPKHGATVFWAIKGEGGDPETAAVVAIPPR